MDYQKLKILLPKQPIKWNINDIAIWLQFIGLQALYPAFKSAAIDGSCLSSLNEQDLRTELKIQSGITVKKLMTWIKIGMKQYEEFLKKQTEGILCKQFLYQEQTLFPPGQRKNATFKTKKQSKNNKIKPMFQEEQIQREIKQIITLQKLQNQIPKKQRVQLIIQQCDSPQTTFYSLKEQGGKIGRHSSNQILILQESVSRYHAQIEFQNCEFYLRDIGSTTGTFLKIVDKLELQQGMIIEMGSNHFLIQKIQGNKLKFIIIEGTNVNYQLQIEIKKSTPISIGRKTNNQIFFTDDQHLSNSHAKIFMIQDKIFLEDLNTTNGTWLRLSPQGENSQRYKISNNTIFKIGGSLTYICKKNSSQMIQKQPINSCAICYENDKDCLYIPCKHNAACIKCSKNLKECPICRVKVEDFIKIYRS